MSFLFNPIVHGQLILTILFAAPTQASTCSDVVKIDRGNSKAIHYTPSEPFMAGVSLSNEVIAHLGNYSRDRNMSGSVWTRYTRDPRFQNVVPPRGEVLMKKLALLVGRRYHSQAFPVYDVISGVNAALNGLKAIKAKQISNDILNNHQILMLQTGHSLGDAFFWTWQKLGLRAINRLFFHRSFPIGLVDRDIDGDGVIFTPKFHPIHDINHVIDYKDIILGDASHASFNEIFYGRFNYDALFSQLTESDQILFDFGYFFYFHESVGNPDWGIQIADLNTSKNLSKDTLQKSYQDHFFLDDNFEFNFDGNNKVKVSFVRNNGYNIDHDILDGIVQRLRNKYNMREHLPIEIENQMTAEPQNEVEIAIRFAEEFLTLFFQIHYNIAAQILHIPKSEPSTLHTPVSP